MNEFFIITQTFDECISVVGVAVCNVCNIEMPMLEFTVVFLCQNGYQIGKNKGDIRGLVLNE